MISENLLRASVSISSSGSNTIITAPTSPAYLVVDSILLVPASQTTIQVLSGSTALTGIMSIAQYGMLKIENITNDEDGVFKCAAGEALNISLGGGVTVTGFVNYRKRGI
jgi:hypothetical protein